MSSGVNTAAGEASPPEEEAPILGLERFAALSADIESGAPRDEVIAREGLSVEAWTRAQESWLGKMADEASRKRFDLTNRYNSAFVAQRRGADGVRRAGKKKNARSVLPPAMAAASPALVAPPPSFVAPLPSFVAPQPSFMSAPAPLASTPAPKFIAPPPAVAMPAIIAPGAVAIHASPATPSSTPMNLGGTVAAETISPFASGAPLPFKQGRAVIAEPTAAPARPPPRRGSARTMEGVLSPFTKDATPFSARPEPRPEPPTAPLAPIRAIPRPAFDPDAPMDLSGTVVASSHDPVESGGKLPFRKADAAVRPPPPGPPPPAIGLPFRAAAPPAATPAAPAPAGGGAPAAAQRATRFTLEQFASLSAEIAVTPSAVAQVRGRYGLDEASHRAEAEEWGRRFSADKELFARYGGLFQSYRDWLSRSPR